MTDEVPPSTPAPSLPPKRPTIAKSVRFEVFKRDKFECQYCGASAPKAVLHVDHIQPVSEGGGSDIMNLVTACESCNLGKGARLLSDDAAVTKSKKQLDAMQDRREQREMMVEWKKGLQAADDLDVSKLLEHWREIAPGWTREDFDVRLVKTLFRKFGFPEVWDAMDTAASHYLRYDAAGRVTKESWALAFGKIGGVATRTRMNQQDPDGEEWRKCSAVLASRMMDHDRKWQLTKLLKEARDVGISVEDVWDLARSKDCRWSYFRDDLNTLIDEASKKQEPHDG